jgi:hypothetical protein
VTVKHIYRLSTLVVTLGVVSLLAAGCGPSPGQGIADRIRAANSAIVREVELSPANGWQGGVDDAVYVFLTDEATDAQALDLWCDVVIPAGANRLPVGQVKLLKGFELVAGGGRTGGSLVLREAACP